MQQLTQHAQEIARKRTGLPERRARRFLENGLECAREAEDYSDRQRAYLEGRGRNGCTALAYNGCCLIRSGDGRCVTAYPLPAWFRWRQHYDGCDMSDKGRSDRRLIGGYDCPAVWTLCQFRDIVLKRTALVACSHQPITRSVPGIVVRYGHAERFTGFCRRSPDRTVALLREKGFGNTPYADDGQMGEE